MSASQRRRLGWVGRFARLVVLLSVALQVAVLLLLLVFRSRSPWLLRQVRAFNKRVLNPAMLVFAGSRRWYASVIRHVGRRSGHSYATPVVAEPTTDGFVIPLPYGTDVDWLHNVLTAGRCVLQRNGIEYPVVDPEIIDPSAALPSLSPPRRLAFRLYGVRQFLKLSRLPDAPD